MAMFKSAKAEDLLAMLKVADVEVLTLGCEVLGATVIDDIRRDQLKEKALTRLLALMEWDWPALRLNSLRAVLNLSFEGHPDAPSVLDLSRTPVDYHDLLACAGYLTLRQIDLSGCSGLGPKIGQGLAAIPGLTCVRVARCNEINDKQMNVISDISQLTDLDIADCFKVTDAVLAPIPLTRCTCACDDSSFVCVARLKCGSRYCKKFLLYHV